MTRLSDTAHTTAEDVAVALAFAPHGQPLTEIEARYDLAQATEARPDAHYAARWGWVRQDVATLRGGISWRDRDALPTVRRGSR